MTKKEIRSYRHLDKEARKLIEQGLNEKRSFSYIACVTSVDVSTIRREIIRNRTPEYASQSKGADKTDCVHLKGCKRKGLCKGGYCDMRLCKHCKMRKCEKCCPDYEAKTCKATQRAPLCCNACEHFGRCILDRYRYSADVADVKATMRASESRDGIDLTKEEIDTLVQTVTEGLRMGQSIHHIFATCDLPVSERSFYRYVEDEVIPIKSIDLAKKVRYKKRKPKKRIGHKSGFYAGHEYENYLELTEEDRSHTTEVDTVLGKKGNRKCILTLHRTDLRLQLYLLLQNKTAECVVRALDWLEECSSGLFSEFFGLMLFDRGSEFDDIAGIERSCEHGGLRCAAYFADPSRPDQRGSAEKNHVELRKLIPKGTSLEALDAFTLAEICSHVNSSVRKGCGDVSPMELAQLVMPKELFDNLGLRLISPKDVIGTPGILYRP